MMAGMELSARSIREQIASALEMVAHVSRLADGTRRVLSVQEILGMEGNLVTMAEIFRYVPTGVDSNGKVVGYFEATGLVPRCADRIRVAGVELPSHLFERGRRLAAP